MLNILIFQLQQKLQVLAPKMYVHLNLFHIEITSRMFDIGWYNGTKYIQILAFYNCTISQITSNTFKTFPGRDAFPIIHTLILWSTVHRYSPDFFHSFRWLEMFDMTDCPVDLNFTNAFGLTRFSFLVSVQIHGAISNQSRALTSTTFHGLLKIRTLALIRCNIEAIESNTFDLVGRTLTYLNLSENRLTKISATFFRAIFDTFSDAYRYMYLAPNPFVCDCDFYEFRNWSIYLRNYQSVHSNESLPLKLQCIGPSHPMQCANLQTISKEKFHFPLSKIDVYSFPKVDLRVIGSLLLIKPNSSLNFRIFIDQHKIAEKRKHSKCPSPEWLRNSIACLSWATGDSDRSILVPVGKYLYASEFTTFHAILIEPNKRVWPLHIQTVFNNPNKKLTELDAVDVVVMLASCLTGALCGILLSMCQRKYCTVIPDGGPDRAR